MRGWLLVALLGGSALAQEGPAARQAPRRSWLTGAGLMLAAGGAVAIAVGTYHLAQADGARRALGAYYANGAAPAAAEASMVRWLEERSVSLGSLGPGLLLSGGAALVLGVGLVLIDGWAAPAPGPSISVSVHPARASVVVSGTF